MKKEKFKDKPYIEQQNYINKVKNNRKSIWETFGINICREQGVDNNKLHYARKI